MHQEASTELLEVFDRIIGRNIHELDAEGTCVCYVAFLQASAREDVRVRSKVLSFLLGRLSDKLGELGT
jgi:hypothetical protein